MNHYFSLYFPNFFSHPERHARLILLTRFILSLLFSAQEILEAHNHVHTGYTSLLTIISLQIIYLFFLFTNKTPSTLGFLHLLTIFFRDMTNQNAQEKIHLNSLRYLVLFSVQNYPIMICLICALLYYGLHVLSVNRGEFQAQLSMETYTTTLVTLILVLIIHYTQLKSVSQQYQNARFESEKLKKQIKDLNQELQKIKEESKQAAQSQDLFVACVSHEFRNPLNILLGNIDILYSSVQDPNQIQILNLCKICGDSLLSQINNLLDVAKINMGKLDIHELPTKMSSFLNEFWNAMKHNIENKGLTGNLMIDRNFPLWINIDNHRLRQILYNILDNAIKFTSKGSIKVKLSWQQPLLDEQSISPERESMIFDDPHDSSNGDWKSRKNTKSDIPIPSLNLDESNHISFNTQEPIQTRIDRILANAQPIDSEGRIRIDIIDTGCGIPISAQKRIFDSFVQGDRTITRSHGGIGVGLYIAKSLVKAMNGEITLESKLGKGTHIKILIPVTVFSQAEVFPSEEQLQQEITTRKRKSSGIPSIVRMPPSSPKKFLSQLNFPSPTKTVLIVDDNQFNQKIMESYFKTLQIDAEFACNGLQGLQMYQDHPDKYFLITMDIQMPVMDGITACKYIRSFEKRQSRKKVPLIIVSGNCNESEMKECLESKEIMADYFFRKPFGLEDCKMCVQKILNLNH